MPTKKVGSQGSGQVVLSRPSGTNSWLPPSDQRDQLLGSVAKCRATAGLSGWPKYSRAKLDTVSFGIPRVEPQIRGLQTWRRHLW